MGNGKITVKACEGVEERKLLSALLMSAASRSRKLCRLGETERSCQQRRAGREVRMSAEKVLGTVLPKIRAVFGRDAPFGAEAAETASLEEQLQGWGEVILMTDKVLRWERAWFPLALMSVVSFSFLMVYYLDPSVLSGVSCLVMFLCLADYLVPALAPRIFGSNKWTTEQQQRFHEICSNLVKSRRRIVGWWKRLFTLKEEKPKMYFMTMIFSLAVVAWIGQQVHNLFLTYLIVSFLLLFPGLNQHGIITKYVGMAKREINKLLKHKEKKN
ncbi:ADP-ribosylation factor-like protein 6-interacting protein 1 isoform 1-T1 [Spheniscus humboldti]